MGAGLGEPPQTVTDFRAPRAGTLVPLLFPQNRTAGYDPQRWPLARWIRIVAQPCAVPEDHGGGGVHRFLAVMVVLLGLASSVRSLDTYASAEPASANEALNPTSADCAPEKNKKKKKRVVTKPPPPEPLVCPACPQVSCPTCPVVQPPPPCPQPPEPQGDGGLTWKDLFLLFAGAILAIYTTLAFERYKRFRDVVLVLARTRQRYEGNPDSVKDVARAHEETKKFWYFIEGQEWILNADGHREAAAKVAVLKGFMYRAAACLANILNDKTKGLSASTYLSQYTIEYGQIYNKHFIRFEDRLRPNWRAILKPGFQPYMPEHATAPAVDFFDKLI